MESALDLISTRATEKHLDTAYVFEGELPAAISGDLTRLRQILLNLLANAVKFTESGEVVLTVTSKPVAAERVELTFAVRDTGIGLTPEGMGRLFQSFSQADSSTTRKYGGTGLGLAISKRLAELMGGSMWAVSEGPGKGSTFLFTIEAQTAHLPPARARPGRRAVGTADQATPDRRRQRHQPPHAGAAIGQMGHGLARHRVPHGSVALARRGENFDLAILDMHMPEMDGLQLAREIHTRHAALPLVLFSSLGRREAEDNEGLFKAYLAKPIRQSHFFDTLVSLLANDEVAKPAAPAPVKPQMDPGMAARHPLRILLGRRQCGEPEARAAAAAADGLPRRSGVQRPRSGGVGAAPDLRRGADGRADARARRPGRHAPHLRAGGPDKRPRIVAMTANAMQGDREMCLAAGMDDYLTKPIRVDQLVKALNNATTRKE